MAVKLDGDEALEVVILDTKNILEGFEGGVVAQNGLDGACNINSTPHSDILARILKAERLQCALLMY
jgi:hypothetical protein